ncbi:hypothetical protein D9758_008560 [Tetrapyrgos nigripes]|uniref:Endoplasmic oxidoreductin n=1 Tax=Tetrapyrgos nigripes TaxID=182062 RepID=A0A8H5LIY0_9AGAR|nr:hypothetical protein D9758_008560 [Tetrapyrgos nigripes]
MRHHRFKNPLRTSVWYIFQTLSAFASGSSLFNPVDPGSSIGGPGLSQEFSQSSPLSFGQGRIDMSVCQNVKPTGPIDATLCDYETVDQVNDALYKNLKELVKVPFFRYLQMDLYRGCPFWQDSETCTASSCSLETVDESEIPEQWRTKALSKIDPLPEDYHQLDKGCYYRDSDFCISEDPTSISGDYFDLSLIPERYTGYSGPGARQIWRSIYEDNCFSALESPDTSLETRSKSGQEKCIEAKVYSRVISGLHASISTHICLDYLNQTTGEWTPNLQCYIERVASHPERLENIYFNVVLLLRAISRLGPHISASDYLYQMQHQVSAAKDNILAEFGSEPGAETRQNRLGVETTKSRLRLARIISFADQAGKFDENVMFKGEDAETLKEEFKAHFRNVTRIMDCIDCDKCRLWGKVQTTGVATALKILFEMDENALSLSPSSSTLLQRSEIVALFNTLHRFSESLRAVQQFRNMWSESEEIRTQMETELEIEVKLPESDADANIVVVDDMDSEERRQNAFINVVNKTCEKVAQLCKDGAVGCVSMISQLWSRGLECLESLATPIPLRTRAEL